MQTVLASIEIMLAILLTLTILLQARGTGLSSTFGGASLFYRSKRGAEKILFITTILLGILFSLTSFLGVVLFS